MPSFPITVQFDIFNICLAGVKSSNILSSGLEVDEGREGGNWGIEEFRRLCQLTTASNKSTTKTVCSWSRRRKEVSSFIIISNIHISLLNFIHVPLLFPLHTHTHSHTRETFIWISTKDRDKDLSSKSMRSDFLQSKLCRWMLNWNRRIPRKETFRFLSLTRSTSKSWVWVSLFLQLNNSWENWMGEFGRSDLKASQWMDRRTKGLKICWMKISRKIEESMQKSYTQESWRSALCMEMVPWLVN